MIDRYNQLKIGVFGGTFDPVHMGHLVVARQLLSKFHIATILFVPASIPPHKSQPVANYFHRVAMLEAALADEPHMSVSPIESERTTASYTIYTLFELKKRMGPQQFFFIIGADAFLELHLWHRYEDLLNETAFIVAARPGFAMSNLHDEIKKLPGNFTYDEFNRVWRRSGRGTIYYFANVGEVVSSTRIRDRLVQGQTITGLLPPRVYDYIEEHRLYGTRGT